MNILKALKYRLIEKPLVYFYYTAKPRCINPINYMRHQYNARAEKTLQTNEALWQTLQTLREKSKSTGCNYGDYLALYNSISTLKPSFILECGSGVSTCIIAYALKERYEKTKEKATFVSMEEHSGYHEQIKEIFPDELRPYVDFQLSDRIESTYNGLYGSHYESLPDHPYDFIFIDGPTSKMSKESPKCFNSDIVNILLKSDGDISGIIDQRIMTYWRLKKLMPEAQITYNVVHQLGYISNAKKTHVAEPIEIHRCSP